ncbi:Asp/Glu racemase [Lutimaribacter marinistellae]|uniref:Asp/Glu racemase n=1 Tax=Lutimaribacter marinistellae TaxID=1820329 RepID=A0ABV7TGA9_9RHOB
MPVFPYSLIEPERPRLGLIVLQSDETLENDFRRLIPRHVSLLVNRIPSGVDVTPESLGAMREHMTASAGLFPRGYRFDAIGYGCTSGTAEIGADSVSQMVKQGCETRHVTDPLTALIAACQSSGVKRLAILSPYVEVVSDKLRQRLADAGIETPAFGTFAEPAEARVARIADEDIVAAGGSLAHGADVDALFLSCTNLRTLNVIRPLMATLSMPVFSSNLVLAWHLLQLTQAAQVPDRPTGLLE